MGFLNWAGKLLLIYIIFVVGTALMAAWVYGLSTVNGQMVVFFSLFAGVPAAIKLMRGFSGQPINR